MRLFEEYDRAARQRLGAGYESVMKDPVPYLDQLLTRYKLFEIANIDHLHTQLPPNRILHIINLYLSKDFLFQKLLRLHFPLSNEADISYEWDLLALAHDLGYPYESAEFSSDVLTVEDLCQKLNLTSFFDQGGSPMFYQNPTYKNYFQYKRSVFEVCDHGIIGSLLLYNHFHTDRLTPDALLHIAYVIATHNVFTANLPSAAMYRQYGLSELIPGDALFKRLPAMHDRYAFYYLYLCMIDILEPINGFHFDDPQQQLQLLRDLSYQVGPNGLEITAGNGCYIERIAKRIYDIAIWMNVKMVVSSPNRLELQVK